MSQLSFYFPSAIPTCCDFSRCNRYPYFFAFMTVLYPYPQESPVWTSFVEMMPVREELIHSSLLAWRTVELSAVLHTPPPPWNQNLRNREQKTPLFILIETETKTFSFGLWREGFFFFFLKEKEADFQNSTHGSCEISMEKIDRRLKTRHKPLKCALLLF